MEVTANGKTFTFPDGTAPELIGDAIDEYFAQSAPKDVGRVEALQSGFVRGVEQSLGGMAQKAQMMSLDDINDKVNKIVEMQMSGQLPMQDKYPGRVSFNRGEAMFLDDPKIMENPNAARDALQTWAVETAQGLKSYEQKETKARQEYAPIQEARPVLSTIGNIGGQMAAIPIPGSQARLPIQALRGAAEGAGIGYIQPTIGNESSAENAKMGAAFGGVAPLVLRPITQAAGAAYRGITGQATPEAESAIKFAQEQQLPLMTSDIAPPETFAGRAAQSLAEKIPVAGTGGARAEQQAARTGAVKSVSERYGMPSEEEIVKSLNKKADKVANAAGKRYTELSGQMGNTIINPNKTVSVIDSQIERLTKAGAIKNPKLTQILQNIKGDITSGAQDVKLMRENRTRFREEIKGESLSVSDTEQKIIDSVYKAMTDDIYNAVSSKLGSNAAASMKQVDTIWAREANEIKNTKLKNIFNKGNLKPEEASKMLFSNDKSEIKTLFSSLDTVGRQNAKAAVIQRAFERSEGSPDKFLNEMKKLKNQTNVFFRGQEGRDLNGLINYLKHTQEAGKAAVTTKSGQEALQVAPFVAIGADLTATGGAATAGFAGYGLLARAYESPAVRDIMAKMSGIEPGSTAFEKLAGKLEAELNRAAAIEPQSEPE